MAKILIGLLTLLSLNPAFAVEVDDIGGFYTPLRDARPALNQHIQSLLRQAAEKTEGCEPTQFEQNLLDALTPTGALQKVFFGGVELFASKSPEVQRYEPDLETSIYHNTPFGRAGVIVAGKLFRIGQVFPSVRVNGVLMGADKLSHFFETGHELFDEHLRSPPAGALSPATFDSLLNHAIELEEDYLGWSMTGVKSFADLDAHLQGALFWRELMNPSSGWWRCEANRIVITRDFDLASFAHPGWSEAINCNEYATKEKTPNLLPFFSGPKESFTEGVGRNIRQLEVHDGRRHQCPIVAEDCRRAASTLRPLLTDPARQLPRLLGPGCREAAGL